MNNQEAIEILKKYKNESEEDYYVKRAEALDKGIKALEDITEISNALVSITERESFSYGFADTCDKAEKWVEENNNGQI